MEPWGKAKGFFSDPYLRQKKASEISSCVVMVCVKKSCINSWLLISGEQISSLLLFHHSL